MTWMSEDKIDEALDMLRSHAPDYAPYAQYLSDWRDTVNRNSDGWAYWDGGTKPARKLSELVEAAMGAARGDGDFPSEADFRKSLTPIKAAATRLGRAAPVLQDPPPAPGMR